MGKYNPFRLWIHVISVAVILLGMIASVVFCRIFRKDQVKCRRLLVGISVFQLGFEILWRLVFWLVRGDSPLGWWPMYPCNLGGLLIPVAAIFRLRRMKQLFYLFGFVGGVLTFAMPDGIFCRDVLVFPILKSICSTRAFCSFLRWNMPPALTAPA